MISLSEVMSGRWSSWGWSDLCVENICWLVPFLTFFGLLTKSWTELRQPGTPGSSQGNELVIRQLHFINVQLKKTQVDEQYDGPFFSLNCKIRDFMQTLEQYFTEDFKGKVISNECCDWCTKHVSNGWPNFSIKRERHISKLIYLLISFRGNEIYHTINLLCSAIQWW